MKLADVGEVVIPGVGLKDGILLDMIADLYGEQKHLHRNQVLASALQIGRKYSFDEQHGVTTAKFAVKSMTTPSTQFHSRFWPFRAPFL